MLGTVSQCNSVTMSQCHSVTVSQCNSVTVLQCNSVTVLQCNSATVSVLQCNSVTPVRRFEARHSLLHFVQSSGDISKDIINRALGRNNGALCFVCSDDRLRMLVEGDQSLLDSVNIVISSS